jgi:hypothetical protein
MRLFYNQESDDNNDNYSWKLIVCEFDIFYFQVVV